MSKLEFGCVEHLRWIRKHMAPQDDEHMENKVKVEQEGTEQEISVIEEMASLRSLLNSRSEIKREPVSKDGIERFYADMPYTYEEADFIHNQAEMLKQAIDLWVSKTLNENGWKSWDEPLETEEE